MTKTQLMVIIDEIPLWFTTLPGKVLSLLWEALGSRALTMKIKLNNYIKNIQVDKENNISLQILQLVERRTFIISLEA